MFLTSTKYSLDFVFVPGMREQWRYVPGPGVLERAMTRSAQTQLC